MIKKHIFFISLFFTTLSSYATTPLDSIGIENNNGKKLIIHKVDPKESYFSISRKYKVNVKSIQDFNNNIALQIGLIIKVPTDLPFEHKLSTSQTSNSFFEYKVIAKDNLNLIAEKFATSVDDIKKLNDLTSNNLQIGQKLKVPFKNTNPENPAKKIEEVQSSTNNPAIITETIEHTVKPKEYLNLIAKNYNTTAEAIKSLNNLTSNNLHIGEVLKIPQTTKPTNNNNPIVENSKSTPVENKIVEKKPTEVITPIVNNSAPEKTFEHTVLAGETIYAIAHKYKLTTFQLKNLNNLSSDEVKVGQKLKIKGEKPLITAQETQEPDSSNIETLKNPNLRRDAGAYGLNRIDEKGAAVWISNPDLDPNKMLVLHKTAPIGTVMQITNPMTNRSTFAKVVGKFTDNEATKDAIIVMTKAVADAVGALDRRFLCNLSYALRDDK